MYSKIYVYYEMTAKVGPASMILFRYKINKRSEKENNSPCDDNSGFTPLISFLKIAERC